MEVCLLSKSSFKAFFHIYKALFFLGMTNRVETSSPQPQQVLTKRRLQELLHEIDPQEQMDDDVEDVRDQLLISH
jgi:hypothetical protein